MASQRGGAGGSGNALLPGLELLERCCVAVLGDEDPGGRPTYKYQDAIDAEAPVARIDDWIISKQSLGPPPSWEQSLGPPLELPVDPAATMSLEALQSGETDLEYRTIPEPQVSPRGSYGNGPQVAEHLNRRPSELSAVSAVEEPVADDMRRWPREVIRKQMEALEVVGELVEGGARYQGEWKGAGRHGRGVFTRPDGSRYEGSFMDGFAHGEGIYTTPEGTRYEGQWREDQAHGEGKYTYPDGTSYEGQWREDQKCGRGVEIGLSTKYEGEFHNGMKHGNGTYTSSTDSISFQGQFKKDVMDGEGKFQFDDGRLYNGQWSKGRMDGQGCMDWPSGSRYEGSFWSGLRHGEGMFIWPDGRVFKGQWCNGKQEGKGVLTNKNGEKNRGEWQDGVPVSLQPIIEPHKDW